MAKETEIERLVVRLVGDDKGYRDMMLNASSMSKVFEEEAESISAAQAKASKSLQEHVKVSKDAKQGVESLTGTMSSLGAAIGVVSPQVGNLVNQVSSLMREMNKASESSSGFSGSLGKIGRMAGIAGGAAAVTVAAMKLYFSQVVLPQMRRDLAIADAENPMFDAVTDSVRREEMTRRMMPMNVLQYEPRRQAFMQDRRDQVQKQEKILSSNIESMKKQYAEAEDKAQGALNLDPKKLFGIPYRLANMPGMGAGFERDAQDMKKQLAEAEQEKARLLNEDRQLDTEQRKSAQAYQMKQSAAALSNAMDLDQIIRDTKLSVEASNPLVNKYTSEWKQVEAQLAKTMAQHRLMMGEFDQYKKDAEGNDVLDESGSKILDVNETMKRYKQALDYPNIDPKFKTDFKKQQAIDFANEITRATLLAELSVDALRNRQGEMLDPLNQELRIRNKINETIDRWEKENARTAPAEIVGAAIETARLEEQNRLIQQGAQLLIQYRDPVDRFIYDQKRLQQIFDEGSFGGGTEGLRAFQRAMRDASEQAHREWYDMNTPKAMDAIQAGTWQSRQSLLEMRMGRTPIPRGELEERQRQQGQPVPVNALPNLAFKNMEDYLKTLVAQNDEKVKFILEPANIA